MNTTQTEQERSHEIIRNEQVRDRGITRKLEVHDPLLLQHCTRTRVMLLQFLLDIPHQQEAIAIRRLELLKETCGPLCRLLDIGGEVTITDGADFYRIGIVLKGHVPIVFEPMISKDRNVGIRRTGFITACVDWRTRVERTPHDRRNMVHNLLERIAGGKKYIPTLSHGALLCIGVGQLIAIPQEAYPIKAASGNALNTRQGAYGFRLCQPRPARINNNIAGLAAAFH